MTNAAALLLAVLLAFIGVLHLCWAIGIYWPFSSKEELTRKVLSDSEDVPSEPLTAVVGVVLIGAGYLALAARWDGLRFVPDWMYVWGMWGLVAVLALRGAVEPFTASKGNPDYTRLNRRAYGPLCCVLALLGVAVAVSA
ncbi:DUF3995 domain-containing protein [Streptomyces gobiensis]|uniref:DUF3995 domain-containing protein n=1 Tax=Streptomyces gobiensis TaxID=2875706 RepID=UPI001E48385E|nr:DUF3995 domain-containing protein [Streptomyces gobiensis]UGY94190.1 DUF3995 domain-containing protein [Streptomyces gobiensis]